ncbi:MAG: hypothetical protein FWB86_06605 [Treponema sp.]|nr:hypothetical protein [Treponema sp.]MCL2251279.1 hypothetical protein [Treponema sp.]
MRDDLDNNSSTYSQLPNCLKCVSFRVTWDTVFPRSCEMFGIKCANLPSAEVFRAQGEHCPAFRLKEGLK